MGIWWPCFSSTSSSTLRSSFLRDGLPDDVKAPPHCLNVLSALGRDVSLWLPLAPSPCLVSWCPQVNSNVVSHWTPQESTEEATKALLLMINSSGYEEGGGKSRCYNLHVHSRRGSSNPLRQQFSTFLLLPPLIYYSSLCCDPQLHNYFIAVSQLYFCYCCELKCK